MAAPPGLPRWCFRLSILLAFAVGAFLRGDQLWRQIPVEDEWHALRKVAASDVPDIISGFGSADFSIPIALFFELLAATVGLDEIGMRIPFLVLGCLAILVFPLLLARDVGCFAASLWAWLLALSPLLVFYSRFARPYGPALVCAVVAVIAFERWWRDGRRGAAVVYTLLAALSVWLLLVTLPFVAAPFVRRLPAAVRERRPLLRLARLAAATALAVLLLLAPALLADFATLRAKAGGAPILPAALAAAGIALLGGSWPLAAAVAILAALGMRSRSELQRSLLFAAASQAAAILVVRPVGIDAQQILARYLLPLGPVLLLCASSGVAQLRSWAAAGGGRLRLAVAFLLVVALALGGPLRGVYGRPSAWIASDLLFSTFFGLESYRGSLREIPPFYRKLGELPAASLRIAEAPASDYIWANPLPLYQRHHRQEQILASTSGLCRGGGRSAVPPDSRGIHLRTVLFANDPAALQAAGVRYLLFHPMLFDETVLDLETPRRVDVAACVAAYRRAVGPPVVETERLVVFDLEAAGRFRR